MTNPDGSYLEQTVCRDPDPCCDPDRCRDRTRATQIPAVYRLLPELRRVSVKQRD